MRCADAWWAPRPRASTRRAERARELVAAGVFDADAMCGELLAALAASHAAATADGASTQTRRDERRRAGALVRGIANPSSRTPPLTSTLMAWTTRDDARIAQTPHAADSRSGSARGIP
jgi:hypothetical protein